MLRVCGGQRLREFRGAKEVHEIEEEVEEGQEVDEVKEGGRNHGGIRIRQEIGISRVCVCKRACLVSCAVSSIKKVVGPLVEMAQLRGRFPNFRAVSIAILLWEGAGRL